MSKFFTYEERLELQKYLKESLSFKEISRRLDKNPTTISIINNAVHWMALKRFFTGEDSIFNNNKNPILCKMTTLIFKSIGAVPIIRDQDDYSCQFGTTIL